MFVEVMGGKLAGGLFALPSRIGLKTAVSQEWIDKIS